MRKSDEKSVEIVRSFSAVGNEPVKEEQGMQELLDKLKADLLEELKTYMNDILNQAIGDMTSQIMNETLNLISTSVNNVYRNSTTINRYRAGYGINIDGKVISVNPAEFLDICT